MRGTLVLCLAIAGCSSPDEDEDGFSIAKGDCDDLDPEISPDAKERCDEVDNDCDGKVDNNAINAETFYLDEDEDGYGVDSDTQESCEAPDGYSSENDDCDDDDEDIHPGADDTPDEDRNCDGDIEPPVVDDDDNDGTLILGDSCHPTPDTDGDGISDDDESISLTNPDDPDSDGDNLADGTEDSDGDGYTDGEELCAGTDLADPSSVIYTGGWPYYADKDSISGGSTAGTSTPGERFGRFLLRDQFGEIVDLFDFYNDNRPVVIEIVAVWAPPAQGLSDWIAGGPDVYGFSSLWGAGPDVIARGDVYWLTVITEDETAQPALPGDATAWANEFPSERIPVLADNSFAVGAYIELSYYPTLILLTPDLLASATPIDYSVILSELDSLFPL